MYTGKNKPLPTYEVNGWFIEKRPNTFAESHVYQATATDSAGYRTARAGFDTLREARAFCTTNDIPSEGLAMTDTPAITNAQRLSNAAQATLTELEKLQKTGKVREDVCRGMIYELWRHARFLDEPLAGITIDSNGRGISWDGTPYAALKRIAKGS